MKVAVAGASGRMGRALMEAILRDSGLQLAAALERPGHPDLGREAGELAGMPCKLKLRAYDAEALGDADVLIDFTRPEGTLGHLEACLRYGKPIVVGTTGFSDAGRERIAEAARRIAIVMAPNMAVGVSCPRPTHAPRLR